MKPLTQLVNQLLSRTEHDWQIKLRAEWSTIMGDLSQRARLERINGSTVVIGVYDSHWMHELHALSRMMLHRMNSALHKLYPEGFTLTAIRCIWVVRKSPGAKARQGNTQQGPEPVSKKPSLKALKAVEKLASKELQDGLLAYYQRCKDELL